MEQNSLIKQIQQIPEFESEIIWYLREFQGNDSHPWEKFINPLFLDFKIQLPILPDACNKSLLIGLTVIAHDYKLVQGRLPGTYRILIHSNGFLDQIKDVHTYLVHSLAKLISFYYQANEKNELEKFESLLAHDAQEWNRHPWVIQEEVMKLLDNHLKTTSIQVNVSINEIPQIMHDYFSRINRKKLENLDEFFEKSEELLSSSDELKEQAKFFLRMLNEIRNGGENLKSRNDILPNFSGLKYN